MDAVQPAIPPADKMFMIGIWIETLIYGINFIVFSGAVYVLMTKRSRTAAHGWLLFTSILLFTSSTIHVALSLRQLLIAFITPSIVMKPGGASLYFATQTYTIAFIKQLLYVVNDVTQNLILIWRLYAVWGCDWRVAVVPFILELVHIGCSFAAVISFWRGASAEDPMVKAWGLAAWVLLLILNMSTTAAVATKIWWVGRKTAAARPGATNIYFGVAYTILESGGLFAGATFIVVVLYLNTPTALDSLAGVNSLVQLATLCPLLIVVRIGLGLTHGRTESGDLRTVDGGYLGPPRFTLGTADSGAPVQIHIHQTQATFSDMHDVIQDDAYALQAVKSDQMHAEV